MGRIHDNASRHPIAQAENRINARCFKNKDTKRMLSIIILLWIPFYAFYLPVAALFTFALCMRAILIRNRPMLMPGLAYDRQTIHMAEPYWKTDKTMVHWTNTLTQWRNYGAQRPPITRQTRSSADADNGLDAFVGQSRSTNILGPFQVK